MCSSPDVNAGYMHVAEVILFHTFLAIAISDCSLHPDR